jgi:hypothetical protein
MGALHNFLRNNFREGEWVGRVCGPRWGNRVANILQDLQGVNCKIQKPTNQEGRGWRIIVDGTSDVSTDIPAPWGSVLDSAVMRAELSGDASDLGSLAQLDMTTEHETDADVIECTEATPSHITVKEDGIYHIDLYAELSIALTGVESIVPQASVFVYADGAETSATRKLRRRLEGGDVALAGSPDGSIVDYSSSGGNIYLAADSVLSVWTYGTPDLSACSCVAISVHLVRPYTE